MGMNNMKGDRMFLGKQDFNFAQKNLLGDAYAYIFFYLYYI